MSSIVYDPSKFEFVARMGRIIPASDTDKSEITQVAYVIPDIPKPISIKVPKLGRNMRASPHVSEDLLQSLKDHCVKGEFKCSCPCSPEERDRQEALLQEMLAGRKRYAEEREHQRNAQYLVNHNFLGEELDIQRRRRQELDNVKRQLNSDNRNNNIGDDDHIFSARVDTPLRTRVVDEMKRLAPVVQTTIEQESHRRLGH